jgi:hypothetical protein
MADERWKRLAEQQGIAYAKTVAQAMDLKLDMDNPADREKLRRVVLDLVAREKNANTIIYTGEGGRDPNTGAQIADQELSGRNLELVQNYD